MKRYLLSLFCAALAGTAWAQGQVLVIPTPQAGAQVLPAVNTTAAAAAATTITQVGLGHAAPCDGCCPKTKTVCVPEPTTVSKTKVLFSSECETKCHRGCQFLKKGGDCDSCKEGGCGHSHVAHYLYKRVETEVCPATKCVPSKVPVCEAPKCATCAPKCAPACAPACPAGKCCASTVAAPSQPVPVMAPANVATTPAAQTLIIIPSVPSAAPAATNSAPSFTPLR